MASQPQNPIGKILRAFVDAIFLLRPTLFVPVWTILLLGWICGAPHKLLGGSARPMGDFWLLLLSFTAVTGYIFILNQIADIDGDRQNRKLFILPDGHLPVWFAWVYALALLAVSITIPALYIDSTAMWLMVAAGVLGYAYSFPPFSYKDKPVAGAVANFLGHGVLTFYVGWYGANSGAEGDSLLSGWLYALSAGFANGAVYLTSTIPDAEGDEAVGKRTFAVVYGVKATALFGAIWVTLSLVAAFLLPHNSWVMWVTALMSTVLFWLFYRSLDPAKSFATFRWPVAFLSLVVALFVPLYIPMVLAVVFGAKFYYKKRFDLDYPSFNKE